ncbi:MAG TPA: CPBP family intramembrane metalloprotease [Rhodobacteraceae bacterium]|nr:CPBP family intramembrane metalloprotease [Paracoccaceae bacterium]
MTNLYHYKPVRYFAYTFAATFTLWGAGAVVSFQEGRDGLYLALMLPGLMAPFLISLAMMATSRQPGMFREFGRRLIDLRLIRPATFPVLFLLMPLVVLASISLSLPFGGSNTQFQLAEGFSFSSGVMPVLLLLMFAATFEELGWRGYAFDSLQYRFSFLAAALLFSVLWAVWHLPLVFVKDSYQYEIWQESPWFAVNFFVSILPMGVIISWICVKNRKSVFAAILFHFIINMSQEALSMTQTTKCIETVVLVVVALGLVLSDRQFFLSRRTPLLAGA